jgi:PKD repeat protein
LKNVLHKLLFVSSFCLLTLSSFAQSLDSAEYFFDTDPGVGNGISVAVTSGDTIRDSVFTNTSGLTAGFHNLYVRVKDTNQVWSLYEGGRFYLYDTIAQSVPASHPIGSAEYFFDTDPGIDSGIAITNFAFADTVILMDTLSTDTLAAGTHRLYIRVRDTMNVWSLYEGATFTICNFIPVPDFSADTVCLHSATTFTDLSTNIDTSFNYTYGWDFNNDHIIDDTTKGNTSHVFSTSGTHTVSLFVNNTNGCSDTIVKTIYVDSLPMVTLNFPVDTICSDDTLPLSGGLPVGGVYSGGGVYAGAFYADSVSWGYNNITYTYFNSDSCSSFATQYIYVNPCTGIHEYQIADFSVSASPNPFSISTLISLHSTRMRSHSVELVLFDIFGKEIRNTKFESESLKLERGYLPSGIYFYKVIDQNKNYVSGKLIIVD